MNAARRLGLFLLPIFLPWSLACAAAGFSVPPLSGPVVDEAGVLSAGAENQIEQFIRDVKAQSGVQMQLLTLSSLQNLTIEEASLKVVDQWKLGTAKDDKGVLLLIAPTERRLRIEVGQGLEGDIPDAIAQRIIREIITPRLKAGDMDGAAMTGIAAIAKYSGYQGGDREQSQPAPVRRKHSGGGLEKFLFFLFLFIIFILPRGSRRRSGMSGFLLGSVLGGMGRGGGGGGFGGGGGWGGGGGGFSGGGSSGSW